MPSEKELDAQISELQFDNSLFRMPEGEAREHARALIRHTMQLFNGGTAVESVKQIAALAPQPVQRVEPSSLLP